tara:strand:- start:481 stop:1173 length:693 start_codon:yes stop_codon:yes gene_type:complete
MVCSLLPFKAAWMAAFTGSATATVLGLSATGLGTAATYRCLNAMQSGCLQTAPGSIASLILALVIAALDAYQCWTIYLILQYPSFISSSTQRVRILFAWALPFGWLVNIVLASNSAWTIAVALHLAVDPTMIVLANSKETALLVIIISTVIVSDFFAFIYVDIALARTAIIAQILLSAGAGILVMMPGPAVAVASPIPVITPIVKKKIVTQTDDSVLRLRKKSSKTGITF